MINIFVEYRNVVLAKVHLQKIYFTDRVYRVGSFHRANRCIATVSFPWLPEARNQRTVLIFKHFAIFNADKFKESFC